MRKTLNPTAVAGFGIASTRTSCDAGAAAIAPGGDLMLMRGRAGAPGGGS